MIQTLEYLAEWTFANMFFYFEAVADMILYIADILWLVIVKTAVLWSIRSSERFIWRTLLYIQVVDCIVI